MPEPESELAFQANVGLVMLFVDELFAGDASVKAVGLKVSTLNVCALTASVLPAVSFE